MHHCVAAVEFERAVGVDISLATGLLEAVSELATPFVKPAERGSGMRPGKKWVQSQGLIKQLAGHFVRLERALADQRQAPQR